MPKHKKPFIHVNLYLFSYLFLLFIVNSLILWKLNANFELHILYIIMVLSTAWIFLLCNQFKKKFNYYFYKKSVKHDGIIPFTTYYYDGSTGSISFADNSKKIHNEKSPAVTDSLVGEEFPDTANEWWFNGKLLIKDDSNEDQNKIMQTIKTLKEKHILSNKLKNFS